MSNKFKFDYFIWSFIYEDFERDETMNFLIKKNNIMQFNEYIDLNFDTGSKKNKNVYSHLKELFFTIYLIDREFIKKLGIFDNDKTKNEKEYKSILDFSNNYSTNYTPYEEIDFLFQQFKKINIDNKYILIQHTDFSNNTKKEIIDLRKKNYNQKFEKIIFDLAKLYQIKLIDTKEIFQIMSEQEKRKIWFDHHTPKGNKVIAELISKNINF